MNGITMPIDTVTTLSPSRNDRDNKTGFPGSPTSLGSRASDATHDRISRHNPAMGRATGPTNPTASLSKFWTKILGFDKIL
ncbi:MAG: hypothetical protein ACK4RK_02625 [Gemmataceae bacterium]